MGGQVQIAFYCLTVAQYCAILLRNGIDDPAGPGEERKVNDNHYTGQLVGKDKDGKYAENPWSIDHEEDHNSTMVGLSTASGRIVALVVNDDSRRPLRSHEAELDANARRLVACWNACAGKSTDLLEAAAEYDAAPDDAEWEAPHPIFQMASEIDRLKALRDDLVEALAMYSLTLTGDDKLDNAEFGTYAVVREKMRRIAISKAGAA